ncbi:MAG: GxxExxY protein [Leptolyngbya sp. PLA3]|nr:MAG: GxxExxY protein [Cyanobacteria bacterium CYA]MCE7967677.1 GxxExxY protein [Leptolyngbya sp. PL-A3]
MNGHSDRRGQGRRGDHHHDRGDRGHRDDRGGERGHRGTPLSDLDTKLTELSRRVIGAAIEVHKGLGPGYPREVYVNALKSELKHEEISYKLDHTFDVLFEEEVVGKVKVDMFIGDRFLIKIMAEQRDVRPHERTELRAQLRAADLELGLVINFGERRLKDGLVRVLNPDKLAALKGDTDDEYEDDEYEDDDEFEEEDDNESEDAG